MGIMGCGVSSAAGLLACLVVQEAKDVQHNIML